MLYNTIHYKLLAITYKKLNVAKKEQKDVDNNLSILTRIYNSLNKNQKTQPDFETLKNYRKQILKDLQKIAEFINFRVYCLTDLKNVIQVQKDEFLKNVLILKISRSKLKNKKNREIIKKTYQKSKLKLIEYLDYRLEKVISEKELYIKNQISLSDNKNNSSSSYNQEEYQIMCDVYNIFQQLIQKK